jgi:serine/threonine-protein kinase RsbW
MPWSARTGWPDWAAGNGAVNRLSEQRYAAGVCRVEIKLALSLPREAVSVPVSRQVLDGCLETLGVAPDTRADIALALSEACANVIQHAGPGEEYEVQVSARDRRCVIEVVNTGEWPGSSALVDDPAAATAEHGRGLRIIDAVVDNLQLRSTGRQGTTVHFEKELQWLPGAAGQHLSPVDGAG